MGNFYPYEVFNVYRLVNAKGLKRNDDVEMMCVNLWDVKKEIQSKFNLGEKKEEKYVEIFASVKENRNSKSKSNLYRNKISCRWKLTEIKF